MRINDGVPWRVDLTTAPASEPLTLAEVRDGHLRQISSADEDAYITLLLTVAREHAEGFLRRALITQTWTLYLDRFPRRTIEVPIPPTQSISSIKYVDTAGTLQTWATSQYDVSLGTGPRPRRTRIRPAYGIAWPDTREEMDAVRVEFIAGYGDDAGDVPEAIRHAMKIVIGELYVQRKQSLQDVFQHPAVIRAENLMWRYRLH